MTQQTQTAERPQDAPQDAPQAVAVKPRVIDVKAMLKQLEGFRWTEWLVRLPKGMVFGDLIEPGIWRNVQSNAPTALKKLDRLMIVDYDESWAATAVVAGASEKGVTLSKPVKIELEPRTERLFENEEFRIVWVGNGYRVQRKIDGVFVTEEVASLELAERDLRNRYPRKAA